MADGCQMDSASSIRKCLIQSASTRDSTRTGTLLFHLFWLWRELKMRNYRVKLGSAL